MLYTMSRSNQFIHCVFFTLFLSHLSFASELEIGKQNVKLLESIVDAELVQRESPTYPLNAAKNRQEGWVQLSYVIDKDGTVTDPVVLNSSGIKSFEKAALKAVREWQYAPAIMNGEPIQQCNNKVQLDFALHGKQSAVTRKFKRKYVAIKSALKDKKFAEAQQKIKKLADAKKWNHYEDLMTHYLQVVLANNLGEQGRELKALKKISYSSRAEDAFDASQLLRFLTRQFYLQTQLNEYTDALDTYQRIAESDISEQALAPYKRAETAIRETIEAQKVLVKTGQIRGDRKWHHRLARKHFSFDDIEGQLNRVEVRCKNRREIYSIAADSVWHIPASWGNCSIFVSGKTDTRFSLLELAPELVPQV